MVKRSISKIVELTGDDRCRAVKTKTVFEQPRQRTVTVRHVDRAQSTTQSAQTTVLSIRCVQHNARTGFCLTAEESGIFYN